MNTQEKQLAPPFWRHFDWLDVKFSVLLGLFYFPLKQVELYCDNPGNLGSSIGDIMTIPCIAYILWRAQREPNKLREWGLTTPITVQALLYAVVMFVLAIAILLVACYGYGRALSFDISYIFRMTDYVAGAFPQQFVLCSILLVSLEKMPPLRGAWRMPLLCGVLFFVAHLWAIVHDPSKLTLFSLNLILMGVVVTAYFLRFRTIIPIVALHAFVFVLTTNWLAGYF